MGERKEVFISYSHRDAKWLERLRVHLRPLEREHKVEIWDDTRITPGSRWREQIRGSIESAKIAVLLVSADFLASEFIATDELPSLLSAAQQDGVTVLPIHVSPSRFSKSALSEFQALNNPERPLIKMSRSEQESVLVGLTEIIESVLMPAPEPDSVFRTTPAETLNTKAASSEKAPSAAPPREAKSKWERRGQTEGESTFPAYDINCRYCGKRISSDDQFCPLCGSEQPSTGQTLLGRAKLVVAAVSGPIAFFDIEKESTLIGRRGSPDDEPPDIDLTKFDSDKKVSRLHARILRMGTLFFIEDLNSTNGTVINNGLRLTPQQPRIIKFGDKLRLGGTTLHFID